MSRKKRYSDRLDERLRDAHRPNTYDFSIPSYVKTAELPVLQESMERTVVESSTEQVTPPAVDLVINEQRAEQLLDSFQNDMVGDTYISTNDVHHYSDEVISENIAQEGQDQAEQESSILGVNNLLNDFSLPVFTAETSPAEPPPRLYFTSTSSISDGGDPICYRCKCRSQYHPDNGPCVRCTYDCRRFAGRDVADRIDFTDLLKWSKKYIRAKRGRTIDDVKKIWARVYKNTEYLAHCQNRTCKTALVLNNQMSRSFINRQNGLACLGCKNCPKCCTCLICKMCTRRQRADYICGACKSCFNLNCCACRRCEYCGKKCHGDYCRGCGRCNNCCECRSQNCVPLYFHKPKFYKPSKREHEINPASRYIAAEIEVAGIERNGKPIYDVVKRWGASTVHDGSLRDGGFEINTTPAGGDLFVKQVKEICDVLHNEGAFIDYKCGLHVHVDARDIDYYQIRRLVRTYATIEPALFAMVPAERQDSRFCKPCAYLYLAAIEEGRLPYSKVKNDVISSVYMCESTQDIRNGKYHNSRYNALNLHSWLYRGTIESRMFNGTINADDIVNWGILWAMIIDYVADKTDEEVGIVTNNHSIKCLCDIVCGNVRVLNFIKERILRFGDRDMKKYVKDYMHS